MADDLNPSGPEAGVAFREEADRLVLSSAFVTIAFSSATGAIVALTHRESGVGFVDADEAESAGWLWEMTLTRRGGDPVTVTSRACDAFTHSVGRHRHGGALRLWLQWRGFPTPAGHLDGAVTAHLSLRGDSAAIEFEEEIEPPEGWSVEAFTFPCVTAVSDPDPVAKDGVFLPISGGILIPNPRALASPGGSRGWCVDYPGPASLQLLGYCGDRVTLWLAPRDGGGAHKCLAASPMPSSSRLRLSVTSRPAARSDGRWSTGYPTAVGVVGGDWFEAAREYRAWAAGQPWAAGGRVGERALPPLASASGLWASHWGGARRAASAARELQRIVNVPIKLDWRAWHACPREGAYPDYLPPRDGEDAFADAKAQLADAGVLDQLSLIALLASPDSAAWNDHDLAPHALAAGGETGPHRRAAKSPLVAMCPGAAHWRGIVASLARAIAERGADGVYLEGLGATPPRACEQPAHDHGPPTATQWAASVRELIAQVRSALGHGRQIAIEGPVEPYLDLVDVFMSNHAAAERELALAEECGHSWVPIPLVAAVYHDHTTTVGPAASLAPYRPHDPLWPAAAIAELREPASLMQRDYQTQFCLEVARAAMWGQQPLLDNFHPEQARDEGNRHKLAFLAAALRAQAWGIGALLPQSQFMGPVAVDSPSLEADFLFNPAGASPAARRSVRRSVPAVQGSAWRVPGGGIALVMVNIGSQPADFTARLRSSRLTLQLPLRLIGRTFSEDGDVPAASLRASGTEITGRLPGRAVVLVSVR